MQKPITKSTASPPMSTARPASDLAALGQPGGQLGLQGGEVDQAEAIEQAGDPPRQDADDPLEVAAEVDLAGLDLGVQRGHLLHQRDADQRQRQDHHAAG